MLTREETRFLEMWREQREGSPAKYYLLYTIAWGLLTSFLIFFGLMLLGKISLIPIADDNLKIVVLILIGFVCGFTIAWTTRNRNEKRYKKLIEKNKNFPSDSSAN